MFGRLDANPGHRLTFVMYSVPLERLEIQPIHCKELGVLTVRPSLSSRTIAPKTGKLDEVGIPPTSTNK